MRRRVGKREVFDGPSQQTPGAVDIAGRLNQRDQACADEAYRRAHDAVELVSEPRVFFPLAS
jgi:hypothetical protein